MYVVMCNKRLSRRLQECRRKNNTSRMSAMCKTARPVCFPYSTVLVLTSTVIPYVLYLYLYSYEYSNLNVISASGVSLLLSHQYSYRMPPTTRCDFACILRIDIHRYRYTRTVRAGASEPRAHARGRAGGEPEARAKRGRGGAWCVPY